MSDGCQFFKVKDIARKRRQPADAKRARVLNLRRTKNMKVLIGYDGSNSADAALDELQRAGLPADTEILVVAVGSIWMPPTDIASLPAQALTSRRVAATMAQLQTQAEQTLKEMEEMTNKAATRIRADFPQWTVRTEVMNGDAGSALIEKAADWQADLIVVGSQNRSAVGRFFLGSVSQKVFIEADCSVRVARGGARTIDKNAPQRILAGIDAAETGSLLVEALARREWAKQSVLMLVTATDTFNENAVQPFGQIISAQEFLKAAKEKLAASGLKVLTVVKEGDANTILLAEAEKLSADCIFVGTRDIRGTLDRFLIGSVSSGVVADAQCSVEVIRARAD